MYNWITLLYSRNYHSIINQLYFNKKGVYYSIWGTLPGFAHSSTCNLGIESHTSLWQEWQVSLVASVLRTHMPNSFSTYITGLLWTASILRLCFQVNISSFSNNHFDNPAFIVYVCVCLDSGVLLFATPWTVAHQVALSVGILQTRILEWVVISFSTSSSQPRDCTHPNSGSPTLQADY